MPNGKGIFIWQGKNIAKGSIQATVATCVDMRLTWVALKIGDRASPYYASYADMVAAVDAFHAAGILVWGWHYIYGGIMITQTGEAVPYGASAVQEAQFANGEVLRLELDGYIIDAEKEFKQYAQKERATSFVNTLDVPVPVALCSYRFPSLHREFPWNEFLASDVSLHMPQVYWGPGRSASDLNQSIAELTAIKNLPVVPVGRAYIGDGNANPTPAEIKLFMDTAVQKKLTGCSFWALDFLALHVGGTERQQTIKDYDWPGSVPPPVPTGPTAIGKARVTATGVLNIRSGPDTTFSDVGDLATGVEMYVFELNGAWARIGVNAWIKTGAGLADYVSF